MQAVGEQAGRTPGAVHCKGHGLRNFTPRPSRCKFPECPTAAVQAARRPRRCSARGRHGRPRTAQDRTARPRPRLQDPGMRGTEAHVPAHRVLGLQRIAGETTSARKRRSRLSPACDAAACTSGSGGKHCRPKEGTHNPDPRTPGCEAAQKRPVSRTGMQSCPRPEPLPPVKLPISVRHIASSAQRVRSPRQFAKVRKSRFLGQRPGVPVGRVVACPRNRREALLQGKGPPRRDWSVFWQVLHVSVLYLGPSQFRSLWQDTKLKPLNP